MKTQIPINQVDFISEQDIRILLQKNFPNPMANVVRDAFIIACFTGLSYSDLSRITNENIISVIRNKYWLSIDIPKTAQVRKIPLLDIPYKIIREYQMQKNDRLLPIPSQQLFNWYLKDICSKCGIDKRITSLSARKTFIVIAYANDISIQEIANILGYNSLKKIVATLNITQEKISRDMLVLNSSQKFYKL